jgi:uncharacterized protein YndB with AHSA1/START domain
MATNDLLVRVHETINAPVDKVWDALTNPEMVKQYFFGTNQQSDWKKGSDITWTGEWDGKTYQDKGKIIDVIPNKKLQYTYLSSMSGKEDKPENYATVSIELSGDNNHTELKLEQSGSDSEQGRDHSAENWKMILGEMKKLVEK